MKKSVFLLFFIALLVALSGTAKAKDKYPIKELGNCRDARECYYYCEIPRSSPTCWSYEKYVMNKDVLGESTKSPEEVAREHGITFPITELGNCASAQECMTYCNQPANQTTCFEFGKKKGLIEEGEMSQQGGANEEKFLENAKAKLGCDGKEACMAFCSDMNNRQKCEQFAREQGFSQTQQSPQSNVSQTVIQDAKTQLGCDSETSCRSFCSNPDNQQKCQEFGRQHNLDSRQRREQDQQQDQNLQTYPSLSVTPPCNSPETCREWCKNNPDKCPPSEQRQDTQRPSGYPSGSPSNYPSSFPTYQPNNNAPAQQQNYQQTAPSTFSGCTNQQECYQLCQTNPDKCPGFPTNSTSTSPDNTTNPANIPSGATTEGPR